MTPRVRAIGLGGLGLCVGVALAEGVAWSADEGAFPHLNVYAADPELGTRLRPGATERVAFGGNPATEVRINTQGFRGAEWGPPAAGEVVVVGDSQVFGLGVPEEQSLPAELARASGRPVLNAGVPTYGPLEYLAVIDRLLAERKPAVVVVVVNLANDLFERDRPNRDRHKVWDGWAVRSETMPEAAWDLPGKSWIFRESHLVFAIRRALYTPDDQGDVGVASEGNLTDLVHAGEAPEVAPNDRPPVQSRGPQVDDDVAAVPGEARGGDVTAQVRLAAQARREAEREMLWQLREVDDRWTSDDLVAVEAVRRQNRPGDIVYEREAESARGVTVTAELLRRAAEMKKSAVPALRAWVAAHPEDPAATRIAATLAEYDAAGARLDALATATDEVAVEESPLADFVREAKTRCEAGGAELVVVALPLDVQVSDTEWAKYGKPAQDMGETRSLMTALVATSRRMGVRALDLTDALAAAEPGAFLHADLHMSPKGTAAAGSAMAALLQEEPPTATPGAGFPAGRSRLPTVDEMELAPEVVVRGSTRNRCSTRRRREWLVVDCKGLDQGYSVAEDSAPSVRLDDAPLETAWSVNRQDTQVLMPLIPGREARVTLRWPRLAGAQELEDTTAPWRGGRTETLVVRWDGDVAKLGFEAAIAGADPSREESACSGERWEPTWTNSRQGCARTFSDCRDQVRCARGDQAVPPTCVEGEAAIGAAGWCFSVCDAAHPCAAGVCTDWQGAGVCL